MTFVLRAALRSLTGPHRATNQDSAAAGPGFALVADGVGGHAGGDVASRVTARSVVDAVTRTGDVSDLTSLDDEDLRGVVRAANDAIAQRGQDPRLAGLATTFTGVFAGPHDVRVAHVGDSRAYLVQDGAARRVTHDDSYVQLLVDAGSLPPEEAWWHPQRNLLLHSLAGSPEDLDHLWLLHVEVSPGDRWLLCSDGLTDYVPEDEVLATLAAGDDAEAAADALVAAALAADTRDNVTVVVCDVLAADGAGRDEPVRVAGAAEDLGVPVSGDPAPLPAVDR